MSTYVQLGQYDKTQTAIRCISRFDGLTCNDCALYQAIQLFLLEQTIALSIMMRAFIVSRQSLIIVRSEIPNGVETGVVETT